MDFDLKSMKLRVNELMRVTQPSPWIAGIFYAILTCACTVGLFALMMLESVDKRIIYTLAVLIFLVYIYIKSSSYFYCLKTVHEKEMTFFDIFAALREKQLTVLCLGILKYIFFVIGIIMCFAAVVFPLYWFRFSEFVVADGERNPFKALGESMRLLKGHYLELIKLDLGNIGWFLLRGITLGVAGVYVDTAVCMVYAEFYDYLKAEKQLYQ